MSSHTDRTLMDDDDVIAALRRVDVQAPTYVALDIAELLARGRRARRHRRAFMVPTSSLAIFVVAVLVVAVAHGRSSGDRRLFLAPAALAVKPTRPPATQPDPNYQVLQEALGDDFSIDPESGAVTVRPGSPSAEGLPTGLTLGMQIFVLEQSVQSGELAQFCKPLVEKNVIFSACTTQVLPDGRTVYVQKNRTGSGGVKPGRNPDYLASDGIRILFEKQPQGDLVIVDLGTQENETASTPESRTEARAWLERMTPRLVTAATDPRVQDDARNLERPQKPGRTTPHK